MEQAEVRQRYYKLGSLKPGDRFDLLKIEPGGYKNTLVNGIVDEIIPTVNEMEQEIERTVTITIRRGNERFQVSIGGDTIVQNYGAAPSRRTTLTESSDTIPGFPNTKMPVSPLGMARSPIIPGVKFENE